MLSRTSNKIPLAVFATLIAAAILSFAAYSLTIGRNAGAGEEDGGDWRLNSADIGAVERQAGYEVGLPAYVPNFLELQDTVSIADLGSAGREVIFGWELKDSEENVLRLNQRPGTTTLGGGEPTTIGNYQRGEDRPAQISILEPREPERPYTTVILGWQEGEISYILTGKITDELTESVMREIAASVTTG